jgi:hypothetical protein
MAMCLFFKKSFTPLHIKRPLAPHSPLTFSSIARLMAGNC